MNIVESCRNDVKQKQDLGMEKKRKRLETIWTQENKFHFSISEKNSKQQNLSQTKKKLQDKCLLVILSPMNPLRVMQFRRGSRGRNYENSSI
jgi:hypothetical protein